MKQLTGFAALIIFSLTLTVGCGKDYQTEQPAVERSMIEPSTVPTNLTDTRAPYSVDEPIAPRVTPTPVPTPMPTPTPLPTPKNRTY
ncbi:MAG: hypothetical protein ACFCU1_13810 [Sumerlaeia bacterium]